MMMRMESMVMKMATNMAMRTMGKKRLQQRSKLQMARYLGKTTLTTSIARNSLNNSIKKTLNLRSMASETHGF
jgi:hypothetical protein